MEQLTDEFLVVCHDLFKIYKKEDLEVVGLRGLDLEVRRGEFLAIIGRSGSGKTTLLNLIAGLDKPDTGSVLVAGEDITRYNDAQMTQFRRHTIGFVFQSFGLLPLLSAAENVELALRIAGVGLRERGRRTAELLEQVALSHRAGHRPYELSGGEQQRVAVARALANEPPLLIADEPTGELDSATGAQIFQLLRDVAASGVTVITATHDPFVIEHVDRVIEMDDGAVPTQPPEDSTSPAALSAVAAAPNRALPPRRPAPGR